MNANALRFLHRSGSELYGIKSTSPLAYLLSTAVAVAAFIPARQAVSIDPVSALREG